MRLLALLSSVAIFFSREARATDVSDALHLTDNYPACSFLATDSKTGAPVKNAFAVAEWYKDVSVVEYSPMPCRKNYKVRGPDGSFSIPAAECSGFRHGTTLEVRIKAAGYQVKKFRIFRRPKASRQSPIATYLPIEDCDKIQHLSLDKIGSASEALKQYDDSYNRGQIATVFGDTETYHSQMLAELMSLDASMDMATAKKSYCTTVLRLIPQNQNRAKLIEWTDPYCRE